MYHFGHSYRIDSTGSSLDALFAGKIPNITPIIIEKSIPPMITGQCPYIVLYPNLPLY